MAPSVRMKNGPRFAVRDGLERCIKHGVCQIDICFGPDGPTDGAAVEAVEDQGKRGFSRSDVEFGNVSQPFLVWRGRLEVTVDDVFRHQASLTQI